MKTKTFTNALNVFIMIIGAFMAFKYLGVSTPPVLSGIAFIFIATIGLLENSGEEHTNKRKKK